MTSGSSPTGRPRAALLDRDHLDRQTFGNPALAGEVLAMFTAQVVRLVGEIDAEGADVGLIAHTLIGSARGVGAFALAEVAQEVERAALAGERNEELLVRLRQVASETVVAVGNL